MALWTGQKGGTMNQQSPEYSAEKQTEKRTYRVEEIALLLDISKSSAYNLVNAGHFQIIRIGTAIRISKSSFDKWLEETQSHSKKED